MYLKAKEILSENARKILPSAMGMERVNYIVENIDGIQTDEKLLLLKMFNEMLQLMMTKEASDIELGGHGNDGYIWFRIYGKKSRVEELSQLTNDEASVLIVSLLNLNQRKLLLTNRNLDFSYSFKDETREKEFRFRADAYFELDSLALNMRAIKAAVRPLDSLKFHPIAVKMMSHSYIKFGLSLVTGITGSGKSSTLDSIIDYHNKFDPAHIVIIASPIEYVHKSNTCLIRHREVGRDVLSFKEGVIQALRQDPDIIVIGEMRDPATIMAALEVTDTGHKVFSTLHTSSAVESIDRIIAEINPAEQERVRNRLADVLVTIVSQKLVPTIDGKMILAKEVLVVTPSIKAAIKNNNTGEIYMMINQGAPQGMITMEQDLLNLFKMRKIKRETVVSYANNKTRILQLLKGI